MRFTLLAGLAFATTALAQTSTIQSTSTVTITTHQTITLHRSTTESSTSTHSSSSSHHSVSSAAASSSSSAPYPSADGTVATIAPSGTGASGSATTSHPAAFTGAAVPAVISNHRMALLAAIAVIAAI